MEMVEASLRKQGHEIVEITPPDMFEALKLASLLLNADGCQMFRSFERSGEREDRGANQMGFMMNLPRPFKYLYYLWVKYVRQDNVWAELMRDWHPKSAYENWQLVMQREAYRAKWFDWWNSVDVDCLLTPPNATPALPHDAMKDACGSCGYTFLFNMVRQGSCFLSIAFYTC